MHFALPPATKHIQVIKLNYKKKWSLHKNSQVVKKGVAHAKKCRWKNCEFQGSGPEVAVILG